MRWFDDATKRQIQNVTAASNYITLLYPRCSLLLNFGCQQKSDVLIRKTCTTAHLTMQRSIRFKMWNVHWMSWNGQIQVGIACHMVSWTLVSKLMRYMPQSAVTCFVLPTLNMWIEPLKTKHSLWFRVCHTQQAQCGHVLFSPLVDNVWVNWRVTPHANSDEHLVFDCNIKQEVIDAGAE